MATEAEQSGAILDQPATVRHVGEAIGMLSLSAMFQSLSVVGALADQGAIDPLAVAKWAEFFAVNQSPELDGRTREEIAAVLRKFAGALRETVAAAPGGSRMRQ